MKIHIDNHSRLDIADAAQIVTDLLRREREFMLANTVGGCHFKARDIVIGLLPACKEYPAGEMCFYVMDEKKEGKAK
jgi:hypothetical protein